MIRIAKQTRLKPSDVIVRASKYFGEGGEGLEEKERNPCCISFEGAGGYVAVSVVDEDKHTNSRYRIQRVRISGQAIFGNDSMKAFTYDDILMVPSYNHWESRKVVDISMKCKTDKLSLGLPLMTANMDTITESEMANYIGAKGGIGVLHRYMSIEDNVQMFKSCKFPVFVSIGCAETDLQRAEALSDAGADLFCVDVAHAHARYVGRTLKRIRDMIGDSPCIMAGNVATYAGADYLASCSADIVKVGIGGGSVCSTRIKTGFGVPNLTAIKNCARVDRSVVADGGIRHPGDIVKALAFGADFVMVGSMLAGTGQRLDR